MLTNTPCPPPWPETPGVGLHGRSSIVKTAMFNLLPLDHYTLLQITRHATPGEIRAAHERALARPGHNRRRLDAACEELLDPARRRNYDKYLDDLRKWLVAAPF